MLIFLLILSLVRRPKLGTLPPSVTLRPRGRVLVLAGGLRRKMVFFGVCTGDAEFPLDELAEVGSGGTGGISMFGKGGRGHTGLLMTIEGVSRRPGDGGTLDLGPIVLVPKVGEVELDVKEGEPAAGAVAALSCDIIRGGIGIDRLGFKGRGLVGIGSTATAEVLPVGLAAFSVPLIVGKTLFGTVTCGESAAPGGEGGETMVAGIATAPIAPGGGTPPIPEYRDGSFGATSFLTGTAAFDEPISLLALGRWVLPPVELF